MPWRPRIDAIKLKRADDELALKLLRVREQLQKKERYVTGLEVLLRERLARIDALNGKIEQLRAQNHKPNVSAWWRSCSPKDHHG